MRINPILIGHLDQRRPFIDQQDVESYDFALLVTRDEYEMLNRLVRGEIDPFDYAEELQSVKLVLLDPEETNVQRP